MQHNSSYHILFLFKNVFIRFIEYNSKTKFSFCNFKLCFLSFQICNLISKFDRKISADCFFLLFEISANCNGSHFGLNIISALVSEQKILEWFFSLKICKICINQLKEKLLFIQHTSIQWFIQHPSYLRK